MTNNNPVTQESATSNEGKKNKRGKRPKGRPRKNKDEQKKYPVMVYFDLLPYEALLEVQRQDHGRPLASIVYELVTNGYYKMPLNDEQTALLRSLYNVGNNLNQLTRQANTYGMFTSLATQTKKLADEISDLIIKLNDSI